MTKKEFVQEVIEKVQESPRQIFAGHGLPMVVLKEIAKRSDIIAKLSTILLSTKMAKKGAKGLKKAPGFVIKGYKNYKDFVKRSPLDTQNFMDSLSEKDMSIFNVNNNVITFVCLPNDEASGDESVDIVGGKSVIMEYTRALKKEYRIPGCFYLNVYWADSIVKPADLKQAKAKEKTNKRKYVRRNKTKILAELKKKAQYKLKKIAEANAGLEMQGIKANAALQQFNKFGKALGFDATSQQQAVDRFKKYDAANRRLIRSLTVADKKLYEMAVEAIANKDERTAKLLLKKINNPEITNLVLGKRPMTIDAAKQARVKQYRKQIKAINDKNAELLSAMENAPSAKIKANLRFRIKENQKKVVAIRAKINTLQEGFGLETIKNKAKLIAEVNASIEANNAKGMGIRESLKDAVSKLNLSPQQKEQIRQQVIEEVAEGMPMQVAVQSAIQSQTAVPTSAEEIIEETMSGLDNAGEDELDALSNDTETAEEIMDDDTFIAGDDAVEDFGISSDELDDAINTLTGEEEEEEVLEDTSLAGSDSIADILAKL